MLVIKFRCNCLYWMLYLFQDLQVSFINSIDLKFLMMFISSFLFKEIRIVDARIYYQNKLS